MEGSLPPRDRDRPPDEAGGSEADPDATRPPQSMLRAPTPQALFLAVPQIAQVVRRTPAPEEETLDYLVRLRGSSTPEEAVSFAAFALQPKMGIWWGYECLRGLPERLDPADRAILETVATWTQHPSDANRWRTMQGALFASRRSPAVLLGLAVGWSGGAVAPNDAAPVPGHRTPGAINSAVLSCLAGLDVRTRSVHLARMIGLAASLLRDT